MLNSDILLRFDDESILVKFDFQLLFDVFRLHRLRFYHFFCDKLFFLNLVNTLSDLILLILILNRKKYLGILYSTHLILLEQRIVYLGSLGRQQLGLG